MAAARNFKIPDADTDFSGHARRFYREVIVNTAGPRTGRFVAMGIVRMAEIEGPPLATDTFRVEGHSCGIQIAALMDLSSAGVQFDMSPEIRTGLLKAGVHTAAGPRDSPRNDQ